MSLGGAVSPPWYVLRTKPNQEYRAEENLKSWCDSVYLPLTTERNGFTGREVPLFSGYIFAQFDCELAGKARVTYGVSSLLVFSGRLASVPHDVIEELMQRGERIDLALEEFRALQIGDSVRVASGPLAGIRGKLLSKDPEERKAALLITIFGREKEIQFDAKHIQPLR